MKLLGKGQDPEFWIGIKDNKVYSRYIEELHEYWERKGENIEFKCLPYSKWKLFWETGDRHEYESVYFDRRRFLEHALPLALIYPEEKKYIDKISDAIFAICDEYTWCLPAHQGQNEKNDNARIDLFAAETGFYLSLIYVLIGDRLDSLINDRIKTEIDRRIFTSFTAVENYGWWECGKSNWTAVCVGSLGCTMMLMRPEMFDSAMEKRLTVAMQGFLDGFADDGICTEGCGYWAYGVSFFVQYADMIKTFTGGRIDYFKDEKVRAIATFPQKMFLSQRASVSFADGPCELEYTYGVMHRLKAEYPEDVLIYSPDYGSFDIGCGRVCIRLFGAIWMNEDYYNNPADSTTCFEEYAANAQWLTKRTASYGFAAKAGHNAEMHNHNDVGSFIFAKNGKQLVMDLGAGGYTRQYFSPERYNILEPSSRSHNLPIINGKYQLVGADAAAKDVVYRDGYFAMDIVGAYDADEVRSIHRCFEMTDDAVSMTDTYTFNKSADIVERLVSCEKPEFIADGEIKFGDCVVYYDKDICALDVQIENRTSGEGMICYLVDFRLNEGVTEFKVVMK